MHKSGKAELLKVLDDLKIEIDTIDHPEVFTVEQALQYMKNLEGSFAKNLFLKDKKKKLYLLCTPHEADIKLSDVTKMVRASGSLRFAGEEILHEKLGVTQGAVTLFGLINDVNHDVRLILDKRFTDGYIKRIYFHPLVNSASIGISCDGLMKFLDYTGHIPTLLTFEDVPNV